MCSGLQCDETPRYLSKCLLHRFRCRRHFLFQNNFACFIQNTVERPERSPRSTPIVSFCSLKISFPNTCTVLIFFIAGLLFFVPRARRTLGAYRIPWRPAFSSHLINATYRALTIGVLSI